MAYTDSHESVEGTVKHSEYLLGLDRKLDSAVNNNPNAPIVGCNLSWNQIHYLFETIRLVAAEGQALRRRMRTMVTNRHHLPACAYPHGSCDCGADDKFDKAAAAVTEP